MDTTLLLCGPLLALALVAFHLLIALRGRLKVRRLGEAIIRLLNRKAESIELWKDPALLAQKIRQKKRTWIQMLFSTRLGIWACLASVSFLYFWITGWVSPTQTASYVQNLVTAWFLGVGSSTLVFAFLWSVQSAWRTSSTGAFASRVGLGRIWITRAARTAPRFEEVLQDALKEEKRMDILDFTGHELIAKGSSDGGGVLARLFLRHPEKTIRVLLFNPCSAEIDPDRKSTTVIQSLLGSMEMSRENFESRLRGTLDRIEICNRDREVPIEVRLYSEKPSFRVVAAGNTLFLGAINPRDASGEIPLYETVENHDGASLHGAAHSHFQRVWADSTPVEVQTTATVQSLAAHPMEQEPGANSRSSRFSVVSGSIAS